MTNHSQSHFLICEWKDGLKIDRKEGLSSYMDSSKKVKELELGCTVMAQCGNSDSVLGRISQYSTQKCMPSRHAWLLRI
jgi:hypothetical protein